MYKVDILFSNKTIKLPFNKISWDIKIEQIEL